MLKFHLARATVTDAADTCSLFITASYDEAGFLPAEKVRVENTPDRFVIQKNSYATPTWGDKPNHYKYCNGGISR